MNGNVFISKHKHIEERDGMQPEGRYEDIEGEVETLERTWIARVGWVVSDMGRRGVCIGGESIAEALGVLPE